MKTLLPTFLVIGAQKAGTTWISECTRQHPEVHSSKIKELQFFSSKVVYEKGIEWYSNQFAAGYSGEKAIGEYTPNYLWATDNENEIVESNLCRNIPAKVGAIMPDIKLIVMLRNPVERAISAYFHHIGHGRISPKEDFDDAVTKYGILSKGLYSDQLKKWFNYFPENQFLILFYEESLLESKTDTLRLIFEHIDVNTEFVPKMLEKKINNRQSHLELRIKPYSKIAAKATGKLFSEKIRNHPKFDIPISKKSKLLLKEYFLEPNKELEKLLSRGLPW